MFKLPITPGEIPKPCKTNESYCWDKEHVRMPFSPKNLYPAEDVSCSKYFLIRLRN